MSTVRRYFYDWRDNGLLRTIILNDNLGDGFEGFLYDACVNILTVTKGAAYLHVVLGTA